MKKNALNILTAATPRPDLHKNGMFQVVDTLLRAGTQHNIFWYINIDKPSMFTNEDVDKTVEHINFFEEFYKKFHQPTFSKLETRILVGHEEAHFGAAAKRLYKRVGAVSNIEQHNNVFLWLEDDWEICVNDNIFYELKRFFNSDQDFLLCSSHDYVCGRPFFFKKPFFDVVVDLYKKQKDFGDPEIHLFNSVRKMFQTDDHRMKHPKYKQIDVFRDIGREWREKHQIVKQNKYKAAMFDTTWKLAEETETNGTV